MTRTPEPEPDDRVLVAVREVVRRAGLATSPQPDLYRSAWRQAALAGDGTNDRDPGYAPPRSRRGATRA